MSTILVIDGHPNPDSLCAAIARTYAEHAGDATLIALRDLDFDLRLPGGDPAAVALEPDLVTARAAIRAAKHVVIVTPVWWRSTPALLKGFFDRALLSGEDYRYTDRGFPQGLLKGRSARVIITSDTPPLLHRLLPDTRLRSVTRGTLAFCGFRPVRTTRFAPVRGSSAEKRAGWLTETGRIAEQDRAKLSG